MGCGASGESQPQHGARRGDGSPIDGDIDDAASERKRLVIQEWIDSYNHHLHNSLLDMVPSPSPGIGGGVVASSSEVSRRDNESTLSYSTATPAGAIDEALAAVHHANRPRMAMMTARMQSSVDSRGLDRCNNTSLPSVAIPSLPASITSRKEVVDPSDHQQQSSGPLIGVVATGGLGGDASSSSLQKNASQRRLYASGAPQQGSEAPLVDFLGGNSSGGGHPLRTTPQNASNGSQARRSSLIVAGGGLVCASPLAQRGDRNEAMTPPLERPSEGSGVGNPLLTDLATSAHDGAWNSSGSGTSVRRQFPLPPAPTAHPAPSQRLGGDDVEPSVAVRKHQVASVALTVKVPNQHEVLHAVVLGTSGSELAANPGTSSQGLTPGFRITSTGSTKNVNERFSTRASLATSEGDDNCHGTPHNTATSLMEYSVEDDSSKCFAEALPNQRDALSLQLVEQHTADRLTM